MFANYFAKFHKLFTDNYLLMPTHGVFKDNGKFYVVEMTNGYATVWEINWEIVSNIGEKMESIWREFDDDGKLIGVIKREDGKRFRGKFVKVLAKIGVNP